MATYRTFTATLTELGTLTDDGRMLAADMVLSFRTFPQALRWQETADPGHDHAYTVGVIEYAELDGTLVVATGYLLNTPQADAAVVEIENGVTRPSVDIGAATSIITDQDGNEIDVMDDTIDPFNPDTTIIETLTEGKIMGATLVSIAAFDRPTDIQLTGTIERDDQTVDTVVASLQPVTAAGERAFKDDFRPRRELFDNPNLDGFTHPSYDEATGRVYGHIAPFGRQHTGFAGQSKKVHAPRSESGYAYFHTSHLTAADGADLAVGKLTVACGHAGLKLVSEQAAAHYDQTGTCWAYVRAGEDEHGIWFSGVLHPSADDAMVRDGLASPLSGDWRPINPGQGLELVAALSVNTPGFPLVASAVDDQGDMLALVAALAPRKLASDAEIVKDTPMTTTTAVTAAGPDAPAAPAAKPADDTKPAAKWAKGDQVTIKGADDATPQDVTDVRENVTVYRVGDAWYLEDELEPVDQTPDAPMPPAQTAAAIAKELHALRKRDTAQAAAFAKISASRAARAKALLAKVGR